MFWFNHSHPVLKWLWCARSPFFMTYQCKTKFFMIFLPSAIVHVFICWVILYLEFKVSLSFARLKHCWIGVVRQIEIRISFNHKKFSTKKYAIINVPLLSLHDIFVVLIFLWFLLLLRDKQIKKWYYFDNLLSWFYKLSKEQLTFS